MKHSYIAHSHNNQMRRQTLLVVIMLIMLSLSACQTVPPNTNGLEPPSQFPTLDDFWNGTAEFRVDVPDTGLPLGESDTILLPDGELRSYLHASYQSAGVVDQCGDPVPFPGCMVIYTSQDNGRTFLPLTDQDGPLQCRLACNKCPCDSKIDHVDQQQYPRVAMAPADDAINATDERWWMVYEYRANTFLSRSTDGLNWSTPRELPLTGIWADWLMPCREEEKIGPHPFAPGQYNCLVGSPPGIAFSQDRGARGELFVFVGLGQNPGSMGCYFGPADGPTAMLRKCTHNPLFTALDTYGPLDVMDATANPYFAFRTISSADLLAVGPRHYLFYEGVRGPGPGAAGDTQFGLGLARSTTDEIDGAWETFPGNPILVDLPGNVGLGHADVLVIDGQTILLTSLDNATRSRLVLTWK